MDCFPANRQRKSAQSQNSGELHGLAPDFKRSEAVLQVDPLIVVESIPFGMPVKNRDACKKEKVADGRILHSGQGLQYTSQAYFDLSQESHIQPSMSSPGCPYDNAAMENFLGH